MITYTPRIQNMEIKCIERDCNSPDEYYGTFEECIALAKSAGWKIKGKECVCLQCQRFNENNIERYKIPTLK